MLARLMLDLQSMATTYGRVPSQDQPAELKTKPRTKRGGDVERARSLARVLDNKLVDPLMGLFIPGVGDLLGSLLGVYVVIVASRRRVSPVVIARMLLNLAFDTLFGLIPFLGDIFDFTFKSHQRNVKLLMAAEERGGKASARDWAAVVGAALVFLGAIALVIYGITRLVRAL